MGSDAPVTVRIETLGRVRVTRDGRELEALPGQPVRCALLVYLALEGSVTREAAATLFWADRAPARARHSLSQTLYELRRELGEEWIRADHDSLSVTDALWVDASRFRRAVDEERWLDAIHLYDGPFLGDSYLSAGRGFEAWADRIRNRLAREFRLACTRRIEDLREAGRTGEVLELARRWRELDPLEEEAWHHVVDSLAHQGQRSRALREYERLVELLDAELDVEPVEKTRLLAERIRAGEVEEASRAVGAVEGGSGGRGIGGGGADLGGPGAVAAGEGEIPVRTAADLAGDERDDGGERGSRALSWSPTRAIWIAAGLVAVSVAIGWWARATLGGTTVAEGAERIAVVPFQTSGSGVDEFSEGIVNLVSWNLDEVGALRTVSPRSVLSAWRSRGGELSRGDVLELGRDLGAGSVLTGSVVAAGPNVRLHAELNSVSGRTLARVGAEGPGDLLMELVDTLCIRLLRDVWRSREPVPNLRVSAISTGSIPAVRHYLRGEYLFWRSRFDSAGVAFERAVQIDSTFALAHYRLAEARGWMTPWASREELEALEAAYRHRQRLPADARTLVMASVLDKEGSLASIDTMESYVSRNPYDAEGWHLLADVRFHAQKVLPGDRRDLLDPFERALELSPTMTRALIHPLQLAALENDSALYGRFLGHFREVGGNPGLLASWPRVLWGPPERAQETLVRILTTPTRSPLGPLLRGLATGGNLPAGEVLRAFDEAADRIASGAAPERDRLAFARQWASTLAVYGRLDDLERPLAWIRPRTPAAAAMLTVEASAATGSAAPGLGAARRYLDARGPPDTAAVWLSGLDLSRGRVDAARRRIDRALGPGGLPPDCPYRAVLLAHRGWALALSGDSASGLAQMEDALERVGYGLPAGMAHFARLGLMVERPEQRDRAIDILRTTWGDTEYLVPRHLLLGRALERAGRTEEAGRVYADALRMWEDADPGPRTLLEPAREAVGDRVAGGRSLSGSRASRSPAARPTLP